MARGGAPRPGSIPGRARATLPACAAFPRAFSLSSLNLGTHRNHSSSASDDARAPQRRAAAAGRRSLSWNDIRAAVAARRMPRKRLHRAARAREGARLLASSSRSQARAQRAAGDPVQRATTTTTSAAATAVAARAAAATAAAPPPLLLLPLPPSPHTHTPPPHSSPHENLVFVYVHAAMRAASIRLSWAVEPRSRACVCVPSVEFCYWWALMERGELVVDHHLQSMDYRHYYRKCGRDRLAHGSLGFGSN